MCPWLFRWSVGGGKIFISLRRAFRTSSEVNNIIPNIIMMYDRPIIITLCLTTLLLVEASGNKVKPSDSHHKPIKIGRYLVLWSWLSFFFFSSMYYLVNNNTKYFYFLFFILTVALFHENDDYVNRLAYNVSTKTVNILKSVLPDNKIVQKSEFVVYDTYNVTQVGENKILIQYYTAHFTTHVYVYTRCPLST